MKGKKEEEKPKQIQIDKFDLIQTTKEKVLVFSFNS